MTGWRFCAHADQGGEGAHWLAPGEECEQFPEVAAAIREDEEALAGLRGERDKKDR